MAGNPLPPGSGSLEPPLFRVGERVRHEFESQIGVVMEVLPPAWSTWGDGSKTFDHHYRIDYRGVPGNSSIPTRVHAERQLRFVDAERPRRQR